MKSGDLATRIKLYERATHHHLQPNSHVVIRVDGKAFHTYTRRLRCDKPFDYDLMSAMLSAVIHTAKEMQGFKLAYTQSDEATFLITDTDSHQSQPWFDNDLSKLVSITASAFTMHFNRLFVEGDLSAMFDARAFTVPESDAPNVFVWRQQDWERNSLQMLARTHFSDRELHGKGRKDIHDMLMTKSVNWADLPLSAKNGCFVAADGGCMPEKLNYAQIMQLITT
ncbi:tRNA(His) guanylyltransferase Thg1 family protein [Nocardia jiangxiensis]|uniref:tRNA(His) guanylyltransferase Thg1 family protein n=1 Tax=Nocardia jiangxiensis TaxID=282685 RepID=UPI0002FBD130|nr:tRNA(His) guanylyltransferase Thg1 family protein [Nocardia jiangxiensis]